MDCYGPSYMHDWDSGMLQFRASSWHPPINSHGQRCKGKPQLWLVACVRVCFLARLFLSGGYKLVLASLLVSSLTLCSLCCSSAFCPSPTPLCVHAILHVSVCLCAAKISAVESKFFFSCELMYHALIRQIMLCRSSSLLPRLVLSHS